MFKRGGRLSNKPARDGAAAGGGGGGGRRKGEQLDSLAAKLERKVANCLSCGKIFDCRNVTNDIIRFIGGVPHGACHCSSCTFNFLLQPAAPLLHIACNLMITCWCIWYTSSRATVSIGGSQLVAHVPVAADGACFQFPQTERS